MSKNFVASKTTSGLQRKIFKNKPKRKKYFETGNDVMVKKTIIIV